MSELLECLTSSMPAATEAAQRLREYSDNIRRRVNDLRASNALSSIAVDTSATNISLSFEFLAHMPWPGLFTADDVR